MGEWRSRAGRPEQLPHEMLKSPLVPGLGKRSATLRGCLRPRPAVALVERGTWCPGWAGFPRWPHPRHQQSMASVSQG